jgi:hypothetical protein
MGFAGMQGALAAVFKFQRPRFTVRIGEVIPPVELPPGVPRSEAYEQVAQYVLARIVDLLPAAERPVAADVAEEAFAIEAEAVDGRGAPVVLPPEVALEHASALSRLLYHPALIATLRDRLHLPVQAFECIEAESEPESIERAARSLLAYLRDENPYFLTYRFGSREGGAMRNGLGELSRLAAWARARGLRLRVTPVRRLRRDGERDWVEQRSVGEAHTW